MQNIRLIKAALAEAADKLVAELNVEAKTKIARCVTTPKGFCVHFNDDSRLYVDYLEM